MTVVDSRPAAAGTVDSAQQPLVEVEYFTDPLCCWSWAFEPQWRRLRFELGPQLMWHYRMGGMIPNWQSYDDPINSIHQPSQMGPLWHHARELSGMPLQDRLWIEDPPSSSYPACAAVKAAGLQSAAAAEAYLRALREAAMLRRLNIARTETLQQVADELQQIEAEAPEQPHRFDADRFASDLQRKEAREAFREDLQRSRYLQIGRYPTLVVRRPGEQRGLLLTGYRPYASLWSAVQHVDDRLQPLSQNADRTAYEARWGSVLDRELQELQAPRANPAD